MTLAEDVFRCVTTFVDDGVAGDEDAGDGERDDIGEARNRLAVVVDLSDGGELAGGVGALTSSDFSLKQGNINNISSISNKFLLSFKSNQ